MQKNKITTLLGLAALAACGAPSGTEATTEGASSASTTATTVTYPVNGEFYALASSAANLCVGSASAQGAPVPLVHCPTSATSRSLELVIDAAGHTVIHPTGSTGMCLDVYGGAFQNNQRVDFWPCGDTSNQEWGFQNGQIKSGGGNFCLSTAANPTAGSTLVINACDTGDARQVFIPAQIQVTIESQGTYGGSCITDTAEYEPTAQTLTSCNSAKPQLFAIPVPQQFSELISNGGDCLNIWTGVANKEGILADYNQNVGTYACAGTANENFQWALSGTSGALNTFELQAVGLNPSNGPLAQTTQCLGFVTPTSVAPSGPLASATCGSSYAQSWGLNIPLSHPVVIDPPPKCPHACTGGEVCCSEFAGQPAGCYPVNACNASN